MFKDNDFIVTVLSLPAIVTAMTGQGLWDTLSLFNIEYLITKSLLTQGDRTLVFYER